jgi:predicted RNase H-like nuclease
LISDSARNKFRPFLQPENPLFPRVAAFVRKVKDLGFDFKPLNIEKNKRLLIEVFPSASIWVLGRAGFYSYLGDEATANKVVRRYKKDKQRDEQMIRDTLSGFIRFFEKLNIKKMNLGQWLNCFTDDIYKDNIKGKTFDDLMDAAIACLTGISFLLGKYKVYGKPKNNKGLIVVPWI